MVRMCLGRYRLNQYFPILHSSFNIHNSSFIILHSPFFIHLPVDQAGDETGAEAVVDIDDGDV